MKIVNIGIVAHVDAGKTSLTERILFESKVISKLGRVDHGNTQTDTLDLERQRGITIKASVVSFFVDGFRDRLKVNLIDTPGHADFIAEVERSFSVLDGAVLVISAVEGIQAQTKFLMAILRQLAIPVILFINKIDRMGALAQPLVEQIKETLLPSVLPLYSVENPGVKEAAIVPNRLDASTHLAFVETAIDLLTQYDEQLLEAYLQEGGVTEAQLTASLIRQAQTAKVSPILFGSAMTGVGVPELLGAVATFFPTNDSTVEGALSAVVFKIERETSGEKAAYLRLFSGKLAVRAEVPVLRRGYNGEFALCGAESEKVKRLHLFLSGKRVQADEASAGDFCKIWGLSDVKIGDVVGQWCEKIRHLHFVEPQMESRIEAQNAEQSHALYPALTELAEEDPLIKVSKESFHHELYLRIFGEVQKEVLEAMLLERYGLAVRFSETRVVCIEKPVGTGTGQGLDVMGSARNPFAATIGLRVQPGQPGSGITYSYAVQLGSLPAPLHRAIEETVYETLKQGLYGWEVQDLTVTLTHSGYSSVGSTAGDFRNLTPLVLMEAFQQAGSEVYEPINDFELSAPIDLVSPAMYQLTLAKALFGLPILRPHSFELTGTLPVTTTEAFKRELYSLARGEGIFLTRPAGYRKVEPPYPTRKRTDANPLDRNEYLFHVIGPRAKLYQLA